MKKFILVVFGIYLLLYIWGEQKANLFATVVCVGLIPTMLLRNLWANNLYKISINFVHRSFVFDKYTINNEHCFVRYTPDQKIVVMDNMRTSERQELRTFTLTRKDVPNINRCWYEVCKIFDANTYFDLLAAFWNRYGYKVEIVTIKNTNIKKNPDTNKQNNNPQTQQNNENIIDIKPEDISEENKIIQTYGHSENSNMQYRKYLDDNRGLTEKPIAGIENTENVEFDQFSKNTYQQPSKGTSQNTSNLSDMPYTKSNKLNINTASADDLAKLPGLNIIGAKKAVSYRNKNGYFKNTDEFFQIVGLKEYFKEKISEQIIAEIPPQISNNSPEDNGRIVDL